MNLLTTMVLASALMGAMDFCDGRLLFQRRNSPFSSWAWDDWELDSFFDDPWFSPNHHNVWRQPRRHGNQRHRAEGMADNIDDYMRSAEAEWDRAHGQKRREWEVEQQAKKDAFMRKMRQEKEQELRHKKREQAPPQWEQAPPHREYSRKAEEWGQDGSRGRAEATASGTCSDPDNCYTFTDTNIKRDGFRPRRPAPEQKDEFHSTSAEKTEVKSGEPMVLATVDMPGFRSRDLKLQFTGNTVTVRARRQVSDCDDDSSCSYKKEFEYSFTLPGHVDPRTVQGRLATDGTLTLQGTANSRIPDRVTDDTHRHASSSTSASSFRHSDADERSYRTEDSDEYVTIEVQE